MRTRKNVVEKCDVSKQKNADISYFLSIPENKMYYQPEAYSSGSDKTVATQVIRSFKLLKEYGKVDTSDNPALQNCVDLEGYVWDVILKEFHTYFLHYEDLYEEGMLAIIRETPKYDSSKGTKTTFFYPSIKHAMFVWVSENVMMSTPFLASAEIHINRTMRELSREEDEVFSMTPAEIHDEVVKRYPKAKESVTTIEHVIELKKHRKYMNTGCIETGAWDYAKYEDNVPAYFDPEDWAEDRQVKEFLVTGLSTLDEYHKNLVIDHFGLNGCQPIPLSRLTKKYGKTAHFIKKDLTAALQTMRKVIAPLMADYLD